MKVVTNFPIYNGCLEEYGTMEELAKDCDEAGIDGIEAIWDWDPYTGQMPLPGMSIGYHLTFWSCWIDFWIHDEEALLREFGTWDMVHEYYHGDTRQSIIDTYIRDVGYAMQVDPEYLVFHVSEVNIEEDFTYDFVHTDEQVVDCAIELANTITPYITNGAAFLVENQWWPGFTFTRPEITKRLLDGIDYDNKGIVLDIGHLMNTNTRLRTQADGVRYVNDMLDDEGELSDQIRALHLHQSLSGEYVENNAYRFSQEFLDAESFWDRYSISYRHVLQIDRHQPWTDPSIVQVIDRISPDWINNELSAYGRRPHQEALKTQMDTLRRGGFEH